MPLTTKSTPAGDLKAGDRFLAAHRTEHTVAETITYDEMTRITTTTGDDMHYFADTRVMAYVMVTR